MGDWMTVNIKGTCSAEDVERLKEDLLFDFDFDNYENNAGKRWGPMSFSSNRSLCGLNEWPAEKMDIAANLSERNFSTDDVRDELKRLVKIAPSLDITVLCGGPYESLVCIDSFRVKNGKVRRYGSKKENLRPISEDQTMLNFLLAISGNRRQS